MLRVMLFIEIEVIPMNIGEAVTARILELCREQNISVNKLSSLSGVTQSTVNNIVSGRNNSTTISTIKKLCDGLGSLLRSFSIPICFRSWNRKSNKQTLGSFSVGWT